MTLGIVVLMVVGAIVSTVFARRSVHAEQKRVRDAVRRAYPSKGDVQVVSCKVAPTPSAETNTAHPRARYDCVVVVNGCREIRRFGVAVESEGTPADAVGTPLGPPRPRACG